MFNVFGTSRNYIFINTIMMVIFGVIKQSQCVGKCIYANDI